MSEPTRIHQGKEPVRRHFLKEWLDERNMSPMDLLAALNDEDRSLDLPPIDKSQVYRWIKGQLPQEAMQVRIAAALNLDEPEDLQRSPEDDWLAKMFKAMTAEEKDRARKLLEAAFPRKSA